MLKMLKDSASVELESMCQVVLDMLVCNCPTVVLISFPYSSPLHVCVCVFWSHSSCLVKVHILSQLNYLINT